MSKTSGGFGFLWSIGVIMQNLMSYGQLHSQSGCYFSPDLKLFILRFSSSRTWSENNQLLLNTYIKSTSEWYPKTDIQQGAEGERGGGNVRSLNYYFTIRKSFLQLKISKKKHLGMNIKTQHNLQHHWLLGSASALEHW